MGLDSYIYTASKELAGKVAEYMEKHPDEYDHLDVNWCREDGMIYYARKFSAFHSWMIDNVCGGRDNNDCGNYEIAYETLTRLAEVVHEERLHPGTTEFEPTCGFFFNPAALDEWNTIHIERLDNFLHFLMPLLEEEDGRTHYKGEKWDARISYYASW